jgi:hypothetical protein
MYKLSQPIQTNPINNTFQNDVTKGDLNHFKNITQKRFIDINTKFRKTPVMSLPTDCQITLPPQVNKVVSMKICNIQFPEDGYYLLSNKSNNNVFWIQVSFSPNIPSDSIEIKIPEGNYCTLQDIVDVLNHTYFYKSNNNCSIYADLLKHIVFEIDPITFKASFRTLDPCTYFAIIFYDPSLMIDLTTTFGWLIGFHLELYAFTNNPLTGNAAVSLLTQPRNVYVSLNDFQYNNNGNNVVLIGNSCLDDFILAKYSFMSHQHHQCSGGSSNSVYSLERTYNGPVDIRKLQLKVYDENGAIVDTNGLNIIFTLEIAVLYENFNFSAP